MHAETTPSSSDTTTSASGAAPTASVAARMRGLSSSHTPRSPAISGKALPQTMLASSQIAACCSSCSIGSSSPSIAPATFETIDSGRLTLNTPLRAPRKATSTETRSAAGDPSSAGSMKHSCSNTSRTARPSASDHSAFISGSSHGGVDYGVQQGVGSERLAHEGGPELDEASDALGAALGADHDHRQARGSWLCSERLHELLAVHHRHVDVEQAEVDVALALQHLERLLALRRFVDRFDGQGGHAQDTNHHLAHHRAVVHDQNT